MEFHGLDLERLSEVAHGLGTRLGPGDLLLLSGPMGVGKTTFTRALAFGLGVSTPTEVRSPTFNVCLVHPGRVPLFHVDLFRFADHSDAPRGAAALEALGLAGSSMAEPEGAGEGVTVVEWGELWSDPPTTALRLVLARPPDDAMGPRDLRVCWTDEGWCARLAGWMAGWNEEIRRGDVDSDAS